MTPAEVEQERWERIGYTVDQTVRWVMLPVTIVRAVLTILVLLVFECVVDGHLATCRRADDTDPYVWHEHVFGPWHWWAGHSSNGSSEYALNGRGIWRWQ
jgi:hypothetical protein